MNVGSRSAGAEATARGETAGLCRRIFPSAASMRVKNAQARGGQGGDAKPNPACALQDRHLPSDWHGGTSARATHLRVGAGRGSEPLLGWVHLKGRRLQVHTVCARIASANKRAARVTRDSATGHSHDPSHQRQRVRCGAVCLRVTHVRQPSASQRASERGRK